MIGDVSPGFAAVSALVMCGVAWLLGAGGLVLSLLGRLPRGRGKGPRGFRLIVSAQMVCMTGALVDQIGGLARWPRLARETAGVMAVVAAVAALVILARASIRMEPRPKQAGPGPGSEPSGPA